MGDSTSGDFDAPRPGGPEAYIALRSAQRRRAAAKRRRCQALVVVGVWAAVYLLLFSSLLIDGLRYASQTNEVIPPAPDLSLWGYLVVAWFVLGIVGLAVFLIWAKSPRWPGIGQWPWASRTTTLSTVIGAIGFVLIMTAFGGTRILPFLASLNVMNYPSIFDFWIPAMNDAAGNVSMVIDGVCGAVLSTILILAVPAMILRFYRVRTRWALVILVALQLVISLYFGVIGVLWLLPWALSKAVVYWRWPDARLLAGLLCVEIFDTITTFAGDHKATLYYATGFVLLVVAFVINPRWFLAPRIPTRSTRIARLVGN